MIINFSNIGSGSGGGSGYTLPIATETRLGGVKVGSGLTIDPSTGVLSASGGTGGQKVIDLNALTQQERAALHTELNANSGSANEDYVFYYSSNNTYISEYSNKPLRYQVVQFGQEIKFFLTVGRQDAAYFVVLNVNLKQDGTITSGYRSFNTAQKAGVNQLGMVKVGSGLTIDGSGVLSVSGGTSGSGDYMVVSGLPAEANNGQLFYIPAHSGQIVYEGWVFDAHNVSEDYVARLYKNGNEVFPIYKSGSDFHWDFNNDDELHNVEKGGEDIFYQTDKENGKISIWVLDKSIWTLSLTEGVTTADTQQQTKQIDYAGISYRSEGGSAFTYYGEYVILNYNSENGTAEQRQEIFNYLNSCTEEQLKYVVLSITGVRSNQIDSEGSRVYYCHFLKKIAGRYEFYGIADSPSASGFKRNTSTITVTFNTDASIDIELGKLATIYTGEVNITSHVANIDGEGAFFPRNIYKAIDFYDPTAFVVSLRYGNIIFYPTFESKGDNKCKMYVDDIIDGVRYQGKWVFDYSASASAEYWNETPELYRVVSSLTETGINKISFSSSQLSVSTDYISGLTGETDIFIGGVYPYDASNHPFKLTMDGTNIYLYKGEDYNTGGTYTFYASGACQAGVTISGSDFGGLGIDEITESNGVLYIHLRSDWGSISGECFYLAEDLAYYEGQLAYNKANHKLCLYNGTDWLEVQTTALS